jgi:hypothetical protein
MLSRELSSGEVRMSCGRVLGTFALALGLAGPALAQQSGYQPSGIQQQPGFQQPGAQDQGFQQPGAQDQGYPQQGAAQAPSGQLHPHGQGFGACRQLDQLSNVRVLNSPLGAVIEFDAKDQSQAGQVQQLAHTCIDAQSRMMQMHPGQGVQGQQGALQGQQNGQFQNGQIPNGQIQSGQIQGQPQDRPGAAWQGSFRQEGQYFPRGSTGG